MILQIFRFSELAMYKGSSVDFGVEWGEPGWPAFLCLTWSVAKGMFGLFSWVLLNVNTEIKTMGQTLNPYSEQILLLVFSEVGGFIIQSHSSAT